MEDEERDIVKRETRAVNFLRALLLLLLLAIATFSSLAIYQYTSDEEKDKFEIDFQQSADRIIFSFQDGIERRLGAVNAMANIITSHAHHSNESFPFVTVPNFVTRGSDIRIQADAMVIHYMPLVTDDNREEWERYAMDNRHHLTDAFAEDELQRRTQDRRYNLERQLQQSNASKQITVMEDGTDFHPVIYSSVPGQPRQDEPKGQGPYLPMWQRR